MLKLSKGGESRLPSFLQTNSKGHRQSKEDPQFRSNSLQRRAVPPPSHFRLVPWSLHFLGITLTVQSATSPEAIAGVLYLMANEWYWCNRDVMQNHMVGLIEMIRIGK